MAISAIKQVTKKKMKFRMIPNKEFKASHIADNVGNATLFLSYLQHIKFINYSSPFKE